MRVERIHELIGKTPVVRLQKMHPHDGVSIWLKLEWFNPGGSVKDRIALNMIEGAEREGLIRPGDTLIEPTSGNTGIGLALVAAAKGYRLIIVMPDTLSIERRKILRGYGAQLILTDGSQGMKKAIEVARNLQEQHGYFMPMQFDNLHNPAIHHQATAEEIIADFEHLDVFVAGVGTGGTITGAGQRLKAHYPRLSIKAVEPEDSAILSGKAPGSHKIQGIGAGFIPRILDTTIYDEILTVSNDEAFMTARALATQEGIFAGISTGANVAAALRVARRLKAGQILTVSPSNAERYLSTALFEHLDDTQKKG
ncbi:MAG: cysteine synthase A [Acholeplasmatales bacterium]|nr:MAG: cysteine synthase A [Acholeplasmatales bacterium]